MAGALRPSTWNGHAINDGTVYKARMVVDRGGLEAVGNLRMQPVDAERHGNTPVSSHRQQMAGDIAIEVQLVRNTQADIEALKAWFNPELFKDSDAWLTVRAEDSTVRRISCAPTAMDPTGPLLTNWHIVLHAAKRIWEQNAAPTPTTRDVVATGDTFNLSNTGDGLAYPTLTITPNTIKAAADDYPTRQRVILASRTDLAAMDDPEGDGYPIELSGAALTAPGDDVRVLFKGRELNRWISGDKLWANLQLQPRKKVTLAAGFTNVSVEDITVEEELALDQWPSKGFIVWEDTGEVTQYESIGLQSFGDITRGSIGSTAVAHSAGEAGYFVEHGAWIDIISGKTSPGAPPFPSNKMPCIDLALSSNTEHVWAEPHINLDSESRSRAWQRGFTDDGLSSQHLRAYNDTGQAIFEDTLPSAGKPLGNDLSMAFPVPVKATAGAVTLDMEVAASLLLQAFVEDIEGNESRLITQFWSNGALAGQSFDSGDLLQTLRLHARIAAIYGDLSLTDLSASQMALDISTPVTLVYVSDPSTVATTLSVPVRHAFFMHLDQDSEINGLALACCSVNSGRTLILYVYKAGGIDGGPGSEQIAAIGGSLSTEVPVGSDPSLFALFRSEEVLPAGDYWVVIYPSHNDIKLGIHPTRENPTLFWSQDYIQTWTNLIRPQDSQLIEAHSPISSQTPVFAVLSRTAEPQSDAPLETGSRITAENIDILLDETRAPYVATGAEEDLYLLQSTITNTTTGQAFSLFHPMHLGQSLVVDCENRRVTDGETGLDVPFAFNGEWPYLAPGVNTFSYDEQGVVSTTVSEQHRDRWL